MLKEYHTLVPYVRRYRWGYIAGLFMLLVTSGSQLAIPQFIRVAVDIIASGSIDLRQMGGLMGGLIGVALVIGAARFGFTVQAHASRASFVSGCLITFLPSRAAFTDAIASAILWPAQQTICAPYVWQAGWGSSPCSTA